MTCFLSLRTQFENLGDEVINTMMLRELCSRSEVVALGEGVPDWYIANVRDSLGPLAERMQVVFSQKRFILLMLSKGLFGEHSLMFTSCGDVSGQRSNYLRDISLEALQYLPSMRLGLVGASYSRISKSKSRLLRIASSRSPTLSVRDGLSRDVLAASEISFPVIPDLAFLLPFVTSGPNDRRRLAIFQLREIKQVPFQSSVDQINFLATHARTEGLEPCIAWQVERDAVLGRRLGEATGLPIVTPEGGTRGRVEAFDQLYSKTAVIFSNRLHGLLVAASRGAVPVALLHSDERKVRGIFGDVGMSDLIIAADQPKVVPGALDVPWRMKNQERMEFIFNQSAARLRQFFDDILGTSSLRSDVLRHA